LAGGYWKNGPDGLLIDEVTLLMYDRTKTGFVDVPIQDQFFERL
jgi:hypothetical protein